MNGWKRKAELALAIAKAAPVPNFEAIRHITMYLMIADRAEPFNTTKHLIEKLTAGRE